MFTTMNSLSCKNEELLKKARIHCTSCQRDFAIYAIRHTCNVLVPCGEKVGIKYEERYLPDLARPDTVLETALNGDGRQLAECEKCETKRVRLTQARKCTCPECEYSGWYIHDDSKLCPGCISVKQSIITESIVQIKQPLIELVEKPKPIIRLYVELTPKEMGKQDTICPSKYHAILLTIQGITKETELTGDWSADGFGENFFSSQEDFVMEKLNEYIIRIQSQYNPIWIFNKPIDSIWLRSLYRSHIGDNIPF